MDARPQKKKGLTRDRVLDAALTLFSSKGYGGATTREIAQAAGIAEVTLFRHFPSKELLLEEIFTHHSFLPTLKDLLPEIAELPYEDALQVIAERFLNTLVERKDWIRLLQMEVQCSSGRVHTLFHSFIDELFEAFTTFFRTAQQRGYLAEVDPELAARAFHGIFFCYFHFEEVLQRGKYKPTDRELAVREFVRIFARGTMPTPTV